MREDRIPDLVRYELQDGVVTLTLNWPEQRNTISSSGMPEAIADALQRLSIDEEAKVAILTGSAPAFSAGGDIKRMLARLDQDDIATDAGGRELLHSIQQIPRAFMRTDVPIIAAINGPAVGAGFDLACMCDIRIMAQSAWVAESFIGLGLISGIGGGYFLPRVVGLEKALELSLTGDSLDAAGALACGLVSKVAPDETLMDEARALAWRMARHPREALRRTKQFVRAGSCGSLESTLQLASALQAIAYADPEHRPLVEAAVKQLKQRESDR
jgi:enoyl-CoA hydratase/carnithine racemase